MRAVKIAALRGYFKKLNGEVGGEICLVLIAGFGATDGGNDGCRAAGRQPFVLGEAIAKGRKTRASA